LDNKALHGVGGEQATINQLILDGIDANERNFAKHGTVFKILKVRE
jgi:hypothetical protein